MAQAILLISCPDQKGITASVTDFVYRHNGNIEHADQHIDQQTGTFFMRIAWALDDFSLSPEQVAPHFTPLAQKFSMDWQLFFNQEVPRAAIFVSQRLHCLHDLLLKNAAGQLPCVVSAIISNHSAARAIAEYFKIPFFEFSKTKENKQEQEAKERDLLVAHGVELLILARYGQVFSGSFVDHFPNRIINIHHSFLPAFVGKDPYRQAFLKGVKIIGATSHFVTAELDQGPIIEQDIVRISHRDSVSDIERQGEDLEKIVLGRAVRLYLERKILVYRGKTVVFD